MIDKMRVKILMVTALVAVGLHVLKLHLQSGMHFSWSLMVLPLCGAWCGLVGSGALLGSTFILKLVGMLFGFKARIFFGLPTVCASLYWSTEHRWLRAGIPALCMLLFIAHPVGLYAAPYTLYWLLPIGIAYSTFCNHDVARALASAFTAHAAGSVMHLYLVQTLTSQDWIALIPVVAVERLFLALGMWISYKLLSRLRVTHVVRSARSACIYLLQA